MMGKFGRLEVGPANHATAAIDEGPTSGIAAALTATGLAGACFAFGAAFLVLGDSVWPHAIGVAALGAFIVLGLSALAGEDSRE